MYLKYIYISALKQLPKETSPNVLSAATLQLSIIHLIFIINTTSSLQNVYVVKPLKISQQFQKDKCKAIFDIGDIG